MSLFRQRTKGAVATIAAAFAALAGAGAAYAQPWQPQDDDALLLQVRTGKYVLTGDIRGYMTPGGVCVDFADTVQSLDLAVRVDKKSRRATGWIFEESHRFTLDLESNTVQNVNNSRALGKMDIVDTPEGWCVDTKVLSSWLGVTLRPDLFNSMLVLESDRELPFIAAIERKSRAARLRPKRVAFDLAQLPQADVPYQAWRTPAVDAVVRFKFENRPDKGTSLEKRYEILASGEALGASYDARLASDRHGKPETLRVRAYRVDPSGEMLGPLKATQIAVGDVQTFAGKLSGETAVGRGAVISNRPLFRASSFAATDIRGVLPAGWDAELYRDGQLLAFQSADANGRYEFLGVDLQYGQNAFEVVLYGPQGQIRRERHDFPVGQESIQPGKTTYWAGIVEQGRDLVNFNSRSIDPLTGWRWGVGVERGIDKRTMAGIGLQSLILDDQRESYAEMTLRRALGPMLVELSAAQQFGQGRAYRGEVLGRIGKVNFQAESFMVDGGFRSDMVDDGQRSEHVLRLDSSLKLGAVTVPFQLAALREDRTDGAKVTEWLTRASIVARRMTVTAELRDRQVTGPPSVDRSDAGMHLGLLANTRMLGMSWRGEAQFRLSGPQKGFESARLVVERSLDDRSDLRAEINHQARGNYTDFALGYVREFRRFALRAEGTYNSRHAIGANLALSFSFGPSGDGRGIRFSHEKLARTGQAAVTVFRDDDGDGIREAGEEVIPDVGIEAGFRTTDSATNARGHAVVDGLKPFQPVLVSIDTGSLPDPYLQPVGPGVVVTPRPGVTARIELPLAPTGEVEGIVHGLEGTPREGVELELVNAKGAVVARSLSEYDGFFLLESVPYGQYRLRLAETSAKALGLRAGFLSSAFALGKDNDIIRLGAVRLGTLAQVASGADAAGVHMPALAAAGP
ncbi:MAG: carboxypeptidase regulatory-like domain-containing protein [Caenibius sp.]